MERDSLSKGHPCPSSRSLDQAHFTTPNPPTSHDPYGHPAAWATMAFAMTTAMVCP